VDITEALRYAEQLEQQGCVSTSAAAIRTLARALTAPSAIVQVVSTLADEASKLAPILGSMVEGSSGDPREIYEPAYEPADGDVYVARAAEVLEELSGLMAAILYKEPD
jgi:hypothetical protein